MYQELVVVDKPLAYRMNNLGTKEASVSSSNARV